MSLSYLGEGGEGGEWLGTGGRHRADSETGEPLPDPIESRKGEGGVRAISSSSNTALLKGDSAMRPRTGGGEAWG